MNKLRLFLITFMLFSIIPFVNATWVNDSFNFRKCLAISNTDTKNNHQLEVFEVNISFDSGNINEADQDFLVVYNDSDISYATVTHDVNETDDDSYAVIRFIGNNTVNTNEVKYCIYYGTSDTGITEGIVGNFTVISDLTAVQSPVVDYYNNFESETDGTSPPLGFVNALGSGMAVSDENPFEKTKHLNKTVQSENAQMTLALTPRSEIYIGASMAWSVDGGGFDGISLVPLDGATAMNEIRCNQNQCTYRTTGGRINVVSGVGADVYNSFSNLINCTNDKIITWSNQTEVGPEATPYDIVSCTTTNSIRFEQNGAGSEGHMDLLIISQNKFYNYGIPSTLTVNSEETPSGGADTTPPVIETYNMTSEGGEGCTNWNIDKNNGCITIDTTPTVVVTTDEVATCAMGVFDYNYTDLIGPIPLRECSGAVSTEHTCNLNPYDNLTQQNSYLFIGCKDTTGNEGLASISGSLKIILSSNDAETVGRAAIESGISQALSGEEYSLYTDQKVYARNSANNQLVSTFDKVVKWMNKVWAFNHLTENETSIAAFNITPVFYSIEFINSTFGAINSTVHQLIAETK